MKRLAWFMILAIGFMGIGLFVGACATVLIHDWAMHYDAAWAKKIIDRPDRVFRRVLMIWSFIVMFGLVRRLGWKGFRDCGWQNEDGPEARAGAGVFLLRGFIMGALTMGLVRALAVIMGFHNLSAFEDTNLKIAWKVFQMPFSALIVGVLEETVCRGILYRVIARNSGVVIGALLSSGIFALAHFISPSEADFAGQAGLLSRSCNVFLSAAGMPLSESFWIRFVNLTLIGVALCGLFVRTGSIWMSVACHGAWVLIILMCHYLTDYVPTPAWAWVLGNRSDATDSPAVAVMLAGLAFWGFAGAYKKGKPLKSGGLTWGADAGETARISDWLATRDFRRMNFSATKILKAYPGCEVALSDGIVFKRRTPVGLWRKLRSWFVPCRAHRAFAVGRRLAAVGVPVARPLAWASWRNGLGRAEALLTDEIANAIPLDRLLPEVREDTAKRHELLRRYAELAAMFHGAGFSNRDLKDENVLVSIDRPYKLWAVDLDGARMRRRVTRRRSGRDLFRVGRSLLACGCATRADEQVFFDAYNRLLPDLAQDAFPE